VVAPALRRDYEGKSVNNEEYEARLREAEVEIEEWKEACSIAIADAHGPYDAKAGGTKLREQIAKWKAAERDLAGALEHRDLLSKQCQKHLQKIDELCGFVEAFIPFAAWHGVSADDFSKHWPENDRRWSVGSEGVAVLDAEAAALVARAQAFVEAIRKNKP
jgi:hypothetical protein